MFSFAVIMVYSGILGLVILGYSSYFAYRFKKQRNAETMRLLHNVPDYEDEFEDEFSYPERRPWLIRLFSSVFGFRDSDKLYGDYKLNTFCKTP